MTMQLPFAFRDYQPYARLIRYHTNFGGSPKRALGRLRSMHLASLCIWCWMTIFLRGWDGEHKETQNVGLSSLPGRMFQSSLIVLLTMVEIGISFGYN